MSFFDEFPVPPIPAERPVYPPRPALPRDLAHVPPPPPPEPWQGPPWGGIGGFVPWHMVLVRSKSAIAALHHFEAYPTGLLFEFVTAAPLDAYDPLDRPRPPGVASLAPQEGRRRPPPGNPTSLLRPDTPRIGVRFADGRTAASGRTPTAEEASDRPRFHGFGGLGVGTVFRRTMWLWPLPPPGPLTWFFTWPWLDVDEVSVEVDASVLEAAGAEAAFLSDEYLRS